MDALRSYRAFLPRPVPGPPVLLACAPEEQHTLPLHGLAAALAEVRVPLRLLGGRVPTEALLAAARRTGAAAVFLWRHDLAQPEAGPAELTELARLTHRRPARLLVVGGAGWRAALPSGARYAPDLASAVTLLRTVTR